MVIFQAQLMKSMVFPMILQADNGKLGDSDCSSVMRSTEEMDDECLDQAPDNCWAVPQMPSPPTASGLYWPKISRQWLDATAFVPDICSAPNVDFQHQANGRMPKRQRRS